MTAEASGAIAGVEGDGDSVSITAGVGASSVLSPGGAYSLHDQTAAMSPQLASPATYSAVWTGEHTLVFEGYSTTNSHATFQYLYEHRTSTGGSYARHQGPSMNCVWTESGGTSRSIFASGVSKGYGLAACRKTGTGVSSVYVGWGNKSKGTDSAWAFDPGDPGAQAFHFGRRDLDAQFPLRGFMGSVTFYSTSVSTADLDEWNTKALYDPDWPSGGYVEEDGTWSASVRFSRDRAGYLIPHYGPLSVDHARGVYTGLNFTNAWAADSTDASSWTVVGSPVVTTNVASGPFTRWKNTNTVDRIEDNDGAAFEGVQSDSAGAVAGDYAMGCLLSVGDTGTVRDKVRLTFDTDGGGGKTCDLDIDSGDCEAEPLSGYYRCTCEGSITGLPAYVRGRLLVGSAASDTGSILVDHCQIQDEGFLSPPHPNKDTAGGGAPYVNAAEVDAWHADWSAGGDVSFVFRLNRPTSDADAASENQYFFDVSDGSAHALLFYRLAATAGACTANHICVQTFNSGCAAADYTTLSTSTQSLDARQWYALRYTWTASGDTALYLDSCATSDCQATTEIGSGTGKCGSDVDPDRAHLGIRFSDTFPMDGYLRSLSVKGPP